MAGLERIEVERIERNKYRFYRVLGSEDSGKLTEEWMDFALKDGNLH